MGSTDDKLPLGPEVFKGGKILNFPKKAVPAVGPTPEAPWQSAVDLLHELINDIEHNRIVDPDMIYVAMRVKHPTQEGVYAFPHYQWGPPSPGASLLMSGLLHKHLQRL
jgi:hypothetical protein